MKRQELEDIIRSAGDAAFAVDARGVVVAWNEPCSQLLGVSDSDAVGQPCADLLRWMDEGGPVCEADCCVRRGMRLAKPMTNFDVRVDTPSGQRWCNVSVLRARDGSEACSIHILREIDLRKRLETVVRDYVVGATGASAEDAFKILAIGRSPRQVALTGQETRVLRLLAQGVSTAGIAAELGISTATVGNHVQHLMGKLGARTRIEAIRRAQLAKLV